MSYRRILVATDFSPHARTALEHARDLVRAAGGRVVLMTALDAPDPLTMVGGAIKTPLDLTEARAAAEERLRAEARAVGLGQSLEAVVVRDRRPEVEILAAADQAGADLIVVGTHGFSGVKRWLLGSVSERVLRAATVPVLLVPAPEAADA